MGYITHVTGELHIQPPLTWNEIKNSPFAAKPQLDVKLHIDEQTIETDEGSLVRKTASTLIPAWEGGFKAYNLVKHVQQAVDAFPGHTWSGRLECDGEDDTDLWRVVVRDGRAVKITPRIVWPDEEDQ